MKRFGDVSLWKDFYFFRWSNHLPKFIKTFYEKPNWFHIFGEYGVLIFGKKKKQIAQIRLRAIDFQERNDRKDEIEVSRRYKLIYRLFLNQKFLNEKQTYVLFCLDKQWWEWKDRQEQYSQVMWKEDALVCYFVSCTFIVAAIR